MNYTSQQPKGLSTTFSGARGAVVLFCFELPEEPVSLTDAEREVALLLLAGLSNAQIAERRQAAVRTVCNQVQGLFRKLGVSSRAELAAKMPVLG
jgi:DNA-binding NarL/FixJ family response regulator